MLKDTDKYENDTTHFTYNEYKKKVKKTPNKDVMIFASVFIIGVLIILGFAKILSPNVDVGITVDNEIASSTDDESTGSVIDDRLKRFQLEDSGKKDEEEDMFSPELDEKVVLPKQRKKTVGEMEAQMADLMNAKKAEQQAEKESNKKHSTEEQTQTTSEKKTTTAPTQTAQIVNAKVVVGYYATEKQAEVAKSIMQDAGVNVTPVVKNLGGYYTLQVGAYTSREKAQQAANNLLKSNFPARVIVD